MRRRNGGAGVAPAPLCHAHRRSGSPWVPVSPYHEGRPSVAGRVRTKGRRKPAWMIVRTGPTVPGWKTPQWSAGRRRAARHANTEDGAPNGAPLPHICEGQGKSKAPALAPHTKGAMNHAYFLPPKSKERAVERWQNSSTADTPEPLKSQEKCDFAATLGDSCGARA